MISSYFLANFQSGATKNLPLKKGRSPEVSYLTYRFRAKFFVVPLQKFAKKNFKS